MMTQTKYLSEMGEVVTNSLYPEKSMVGNQEKKKKQKTVDANLNHKPGGATS
jgi:hypothetical protein